MAILAAVYIRFGNARVEAQTAENTLIEPDHSISYAKIDREAKLKAFFQKYHSPLENNTETFVKVADQYGIDYRLLPAISCLESGCGKQMPYQSYNPFGWGVYGGNYISFANFDEAIEKVGEGLNKGYFSKGANTVEKIAPIYNPPNPIKWGGNIKMYMNMIEKMDTQVDQS